MARCFEACSPQMSFSSFGPLVRKQMLVVAVTEHNPHETGRRKETLQQHSPLLRHTQQENYTAFTKAPAHKPSTIS